MNSKTIYAMSENSGGNNRIILRNIAQGSQEWIEVHRGVLTASNFSKIITPTGQPSKQFEAYIYECASSAFADDDEVIAPTYYMQRGLELEAKAREWYQLVFDVEVETVGFVFLDSCLIIGCSPDGLVGDDGLVEFKCIKTVNHLKLIEDGVMPMDYIPQIQGQLWICDRQWCDLVYYHPRLSPMVFRMQRDEEFISTLARLAEAAARRVDKIIKTYQKEA